MVSAMVGLMMVLFGGFQFSATFKPVADAVSKSYGIHGYLMDSYAMKAATKLLSGITLVMWATFSCWPFSQTFCWYYLAAIHV